MKSNHWLFCGLAWMAAATVLAQDATPPAAQVKPASGYAKDAVLDPPVTATVKEDVINVRGQPNTKGEVVSHLKKGDTVTVLEEITLAKPKKGEPADWSRIALPADAKAWVFADYIDTNTMTVSSRRINVRGGPSENFSVLARLKKGEPVKEISEAHGWIQIEPPTNAYAFVASEYLTPSTPAAIPANPAMATEPTAPPPSAAPMTAPTTNTIAEATNTTAAPVVAAPEPAAPPPMATPTNSMPPAAPDMAASAPAPAPAQAADTDTRVVTREGYVRKAINIQAPTDFELHDISSGTLTEYLQTSDTNFSAFLGARVTVTGPESLDHRWPKTPVLQVQTVFLMP